MPSIHKNDFMAILTLVVGIASLAADAAFQTELTSIFGTWSPRILAVLGILGTVSSQVIRILSVPTPQKGT